MALIATQTITEGGIIATETEAAASDTFTNNGKTFVYYKNSSGVQKTITVTTILTSTIDNSMYGDLTKSNATQVVENGEIAFIGPFPTAAYNGDDGEVTIAITPYSEGADAIAILDLE